MADERVAVPVDQRDADAWPIGQIPLMEPADGFDCADAALRSPTSRLTAGPMRRPPIRVCSPIAPAARCRPAKRKRRRSRSRADARDQRAAPAPRQRPQAPHWRRSRGRPAPTASPASQRRPARRCAARSHRRDSQGPAQRSPSGSAISLSISGELAAKVVDHRNIAGEPAHQPMQRIEVLGVGSRRLRSDAGPDRPRNPKSPPWAPEARFHARPAGLRPRCSSIAAP